MKNPPLSSRVCRQVYARAITTCIKQSAEQPGRYRPGYSAPVRFYQKIKRGSVAILLKCPQQVMGDHLGRAAFDLVTLDKMDQLTVFKQSDGRG